LLAIGGLQREKLPTVILCPWLVKPLNKDSLCCAANIIFEEKLFGSKIIKTGKFCRL